MDFFELKRRVYASREYKTRQQIWHHFLRDMPAETACAEFGVWNGGSINYMANVQPDCVFHGFDSFDGLPEDWLPHCPKGTFKGDPSKVRWAKNVVLHKGMFDQTLPEFVRKPPALTRVHIDCDLGSSCTTVLNLLEPVLRQHKPLLLFDEFYNYLHFEEHEFLSFLQFVERTGMEFDVVGRNALHQQVMIQLR